MFFVVLHFALSLMLFARGQAPAGSSDSVIVPSTGEKQGFRISGVVVDALSGVPLRKANVSIAANASVPTRNTRSDEQGRFVFENVAPRKYVLSAQRRGYRRQNYQQHETYTTAIVVGPGLSTEDLRFALTPGAGIAVNVHDELGDPVRGAAVILFEKNNRGGTLAVRPRTRAVTDDLGHYYFGHLEPGVYYVCVSARPWYAEHSGAGNFGGGQTIVSAQQYDRVLDVVYPLTFFPNASDLSEAAPITLRPGDIESADFRLTPIPSLHVLVKTPVPGDSQYFFVQVTQQIGENFREFLQTSAQAVAPGLQDIGGLAPGRFTVRVVAQSSGDSIARWQTVDLSGNAQIDESIPEAPVSVSGIARWEDGSPLSESSKIQFWNTVTEESVVAPVGDDGGFQFKKESIFPGTFEVEVVGQASTIVRSMSTEDAQVTGRRIQISGQQGVRLSIVAARETGSVTGFALRNDKPVSGVMVVLVPQNPQNNLDLFRRDQSDSDGSFSLNAISAGAYTVLAIENGWRLEWSNPAVLQKYMAGGKTVQVKADAETQVRVQVQ